MISVLFNLASVFNTITPLYSKKLGLYTKKTNVGAQKIDESSLNAFKMVIASF